MRKELEQIQKIEMLLNGQLSGQDKIDFENEIAASPGLQTNVKAQQTVQSGLERLMLRAGIKKAALRFKWARWLFRGGASLAGIAVVVCSVLLFTNRAAYNGQSLPKYNELGQKNWVYADSALAAQQFFVNGSKDTIVETKGGIVLAVQAGCFVDQDGQIVTGKVEFVVKEALDAADIIKSGLSTTSNGKLLETGGMFFIDARHNGESLKINDKNSIYAQIPSDSIRAGMQLFHGERMTNGAINWVKPKSIEHDLIPVDINSLNFYPPHFLDSLAKWGYDVRNKKLTDSLYYSLAAFFATNNADTVGGALALLNKVQGNVAMPASSKTSIIKPDSVWSALSLLSKVGSAGVRPASPDCAINPAKIKAIWNDKFQNTLLATREFEERLQSIHFNAPGALDLYIDNLDKPLYQIDSIAASQEKNASQNLLLKFAARHDGKVNVTKKQLLLLKKYYQIKTKLFTLAAAKTEKEYQKKEAELDQKAAVRQMKHGADSASAVLQNYVQEFDLNLKEACRQLGYDETNLTPAPQNTYNVQITTTGWCNIDRYVDESVSNRTTLDFTDKQTVKKAIIKYEQVSFHITDAGKYNRVLVYLLPDKLNSFMNIQQQNGVFTEKLNELIKYKLFCIGYRNGQSYIYTEMNILPKAYPAIQLNEGSEKQINKLLSSLGRNGQTAQLAAEYKYQQEEITEQKREKVKYDSLNLTNNLVRIAFPCWITATPTAAVKADLTRPEKYNQPGVGAVDKKIDY